LSNTPERLSRHWYDLAKLSDSWVGDQALNDVEILVDFIKHKKVFFNAGYANYDKCLSGNFKLIPNKAEIANLKSDYQIMKQSGMFYGDSPKFDEIISELCKREALINDAVKKDQEIIL
jgi:hypothetical protein